MDIAEIKVVIETSFINGESDELLLKANTENYKEVFKGKVTLFVECESNIDHISSDIKAIYIKAKDIKKL